MRIGGEHALADAKAGKDGGFKNATFVEAGKRLRELAALEPFQPGYVSTSHAQSAGMFGDGKAAMDLMGEWLLGMQGPNSSNGKGLADDDIGVLPFPTVPGGKGEATDTLGGDQRASSSPRRRRRRRWISSSSSARRNTPKEAAAAGAYIPVVKGTEAAIKNPIVKQIADDARRHDLSPELLRSGPRALGRARHQRHLGRGRRRPR